MLIRNARVLTLAGAGAARGPAMADLGVIARGDVLVAGDRVAWVGPAPIPREAIAQAGPSMPEIDAHGAVLMPGFVDAHTHMCSTGDRLDEWSMRLAGRSYLDILAAGGGIMSTVRAVRRADERTLADHLVQRVTRAMIHGTTTIEVKSGYGLATEHELKMLRAIAQAAQRTPATLVPTACIGHALDPEVEPGTFVERTIGHTLPAVAALRPGTAIDAYCEKNAWTVEACARLFDAAHALGLPCRVHADQFTSLGMVEHAAQRGFVSVDHLEASSRQTLAALASSASFGVMLPISGFHTDDRYADARAFVDAGGALVVATNCNPGSAPSSSMPLAIALAVRKNRLTPAEAITACTRNAAELLARVDPALAGRGRIVPGARADLLLLRHRDERELAHSLDDDPVERVWCAGRPIDRATGTPTLA